MSQSNHQTDLSPAAPPAQNGQGQANQTHRAGTSGRVRYRPDSIEPKWQRFWLENKTFRAEVDQTKPKYYIMDMFPSQ